MPTTPQGVYGRAPARLRDAFWGIFYVRGRLEQKRVRIGGLRDEFELCEVGWF